MIFFTFNKERDHLSLIFLFQLKSKLDLEDVGEQLSLISSSYPKERHHITYEFQQDHNKHARAGFVAESFKATLGSQDQFLFYF